MKTLLLILLLALGALVNAQSLDADSWIDARVNGLPREASYSTAGIADFINQQFSTDRQKVRAAYSWITSNIHYSKDSMFYRFWGEDPERKLASVLKTRKGVCEDYASLFTAIVRRCSIPAYTITGYTKIMGRVKTTGHSWCAVKVDNEWLLCDPTWDEHCNGNARYFLVAPSAFIDTHFPFDPLWQLQEQPVTAYAFKYGGRTVAAQKLFFHFPDSADAYMALDTLQQKEATARRLIQFGLDDEQVQTWYSYNQMKIRIVKEEADMETFNAAVADYNAAKTLYNDFVNYRNNQFQPARSEAATQDLFSKIDLLLHSAYQKNKLVGSKTENYQYDTDGLQSRLEALSTKVASQKAFVKSSTANNGNAVIAPKK